MAKNDIKKQRIEINLDKHTYEFIKSKNINASKLIRQLLRVALFSGSTNDISAINDIQSNNPVEVAGRVRLPSRALYGFWFWIYLKDLCAKNNN